MANLIQKPLHVGKTDSYSLTVDLTWLNGEAILTATPVSDATYITVDSFSIVGNIIYMYLTGVAKSQTSDVHIGYTTATRSDCDKVRVIVKDC